MSEPDVDPSRTARSGSVSVASFGEFTGDRMLQPLPLISTGSSGPIDPSDFVAWFKAIDLGETNSSSQIHGMSPLVHEPPPPRRIPSFGCASELFANDSLVVETSPSEPAPQRHRVDHGASSELSHTMAPGEAAAAACGAPRVHDRLLGVSRRNLRSFHVVRAVRQPPSDLRRLALRAHALMHCNHVNLQRCHAFSYSRTTDTLEIVLEPMPALLVSDLVNRLPHNEFQVCTYALQIASALAALHTSGIHHGAIKPTNVAVDEQGVVKLGGYLDAAALADGEDAASSHQLGTDGTVSHERILSHGRATPTPTKAQRTPQGTRLTLFRDNYGGPLSAAASGGDLFALGLLALELLRGRERCCDGGRGDAQALVPNYFAPSFCPLRVMREPGAIFEPLYTALASEAALYSSFVAPGVVGLLLQHDVREICASWADIEALFAAAQPPAELDRPIPGNAAALAQSKSVTQCVSPLDAYLGAVDEDSEAAPPPGNARPQWSRVGGGGDAAAGKGSCLTLRGFAGVDEDVDCIASDAERKLIFARDASMRVGGARESFIIAAIVRRSTMLLEASAATGAPAAAAARSGAMLRVGAHTFGASASMSRAAHLNRNAISGSAYPPPRVDESADDASPPHTVSPPLRFASELADSRTMMMMSASAMSGQLPPPPEIALPATLRAPGHKPSVSVPAARSPTGGGGGGGGGANGMSLGATNAHSMGGDLRRGNFFMYSTDSLCHYGAGNAHGASMSRGNLASLTGTSTATRQALNPAQYTMSTRVLQLTSGWLRVGNLGIFQTRGNVSILHAVDELTNRQFIVKRVDIPDAQQRRAVAGRVKNEVELLSMARFRGDVVRTYGSVFHERSGMLVVLQEFVPGMTLEALRKRVALTEPQVAAILRGVVGVLAYLHYQCVPAEAGNVAHFDIKPGNVLLQPGGEIKLIDFGEARRLPPRSKRGVHRNGGNVAGQNGKAVPAALAARIAEHGGDDATTPLQPLDKMQPTGTLLFMAPEMCDSLYSCKADVWATGCLAYYLLSGSLAFADVASTTYGAARHIASLKPDVPFDVPLPAAASPECADFIRACLTVNHAKRPTSEALLAHPWLAGAADSAGKCVSACDVVVPPPLAMTNSAPLLTNRTEISISVHGDADALADDAADILPLPASARFRSSTSAVDRRYSLPGDAPATAAASSTRVGDDDAAARPSHPTADAQLASGLPSNRPSSPSPPDALLTPREKTTCACC
jgi:serine/threonine protein kinase